MYSKFVSKTSSLQNPLSTFWAENLQLTDEKHRRGLAVYLGKDVNKLKAKGGGKWKYMGSEKAMLEAAERFSPYRSLFMWYLWRLSDVDLSALQDDDKVISET